MALTKVTVYKKVNTNNEATTYAGGQGQVFETTNLVWAGPSICDMGDGVKASSDGVNSIIIVGGQGATDKWSRVTLYTSSTVDQIAALT
jgi:hypothetical protein